MKSFEVYLRSSIRTDPDWSLNYVNYGELKEKIQSYSKRRLSLRKLLRGDVHLTEADLELAGCTAATVPKNSSISRSLEGKGVMEDDVNPVGYFKYEDADEKEKSTPIGAEDAMLRLSRMERADFCGLLDKEIAKAATFYGTQLVYLAKSISECETGSRRDSETGKEEGTASPEQYEIVGNEIMEVLAFVVVNMIAVRQILIRYDAFVRTFDGVPLSMWYLQKKARDDGSGDHIENLFHLDALNSLEDQFTSKMRQLQNVWNNASGSPSILDLREHSSQYETFSCLLGKTLNSVERAAGGDIIWRDRFISSLRYYFLLGSKTKGLGLEPKFLLMRGRHLKKEMKTMAKWRETRSLYVEEEDESRKLDPENVLPLILNLLSCFLYLMNNYIIEPSSAYYANALGTSDALSGIMIGASPWFALVSSIGYSFWTNHSYRTPLIFPGTLMLIGNLIYGVAYSYHSMTLCLLGRAITGLGAPRIINRRYIADSVPFSLRTAASAAFAMATAVGAAMGPGMAIVLDFFDFEFYLPVVGQQTFNGMTGPGFFMALSWALFVTVLVFTFKEPSRSGLDELRRREEAAELSKESALTKSPVSSVPLKSEPGSGSGSVERIPSQESFDGEYDSDLDVGVIAVNTSDMDTESSKGTNTGSVFYCIKHITRATLICMALIFMKRIALESVVGSTSVITKNRYGWSVKNVGTLHLVNGIIVIPVSALAGWLSQFYEDRYLSLWLLSITLFGMMFLIDLSDFVSNENDSYNEGHWLAVGPIRYIAGSLIAFSGIEACESYVASLMSKVVPSKLAMGTFNSGLLETLVGTSGRATGDLIITAMGLISLRNLLNLLILPGSMLIFVSIVLIRKNYEILAV